MEGQTLNWPKEKGTTSSGISNELRDSTFAGAANTLLEYKWKVRNTVKKKEAPNPFLFFKIPILQLTR